MVKRGSGSIINISSMAAAIGMPGGAAYGATKAAMSSMTQSWAAELASDGIRVNAVAPGPVYTAVQSPETTASIGETTPMGRAAQAEEIAESIDSWRRSVRATSRARSSRSMAVAPRSRVAVGQPN